MGFLSNITTRLLLTLMISSYVWAQEVTEKSPWSKLQISPDSLCSMPFGNFRVNIYEHSQNSAFLENPARKRYYYLPIALLDHNSAKSEFNNVTKQVEMRFRVQMWDDNLEKQMIDYLTSQGIVGHEIKSFQVQVIPFEKIILATTKPSTIYSISNDWLPYQLDKSVWLTLTCFQQEECNQLRDIMHQDPSNFGHLKILFSLESQTWQTKQMVIRIDKIISDVMASKLIHDGLITEVEENKLLSEMTTNIITEFFYDLEVVSPNSAWEIRNILKELLMEPTNITRRENKSLNGEVKSKPLSKFDLGKLRDSKLIQNRTVSVRYMGAFLSTSVHIVDNSGSVKLGGDFIKSEKERNDFEKTNELKLQTVNSNLTDLKNKFDDIIKTDVRFVAKLLTNFNQTGNHVKYDEVTRNQGGGLDSKTGLFTAPREGMYLFIFNGAFMKVNESQVYFTLNGMEEQTAMKINYTPQQFKLVFGPTITRMIAIMFLNPDDKVGVFLKLGGVSGFNSANIASVRMYHRNSSGTKQLKTFFSGQLLQ